MEEDVELCLEVQVDPASKRILSNPEKCRSTLLDVTVVKPKEVEAFGTKKTNTLRAHEVRKLISSLEKQRRKKQKLLDKLKEDDTIIKIRKHELRKERERISSQAPVDDLERKDFIGIAESVEPLFCEIRRSLKNVETRITNMQDINLVISHTTVDETASQEYVVTKRKKKRLRSTIFQQPVYRAEISPPDMRSLLCKNQKLLGSGDKCVCENCGLVGFLLECQKHPLVHDSPVSQPKLLTRHNQTCLDIPQINKQSNEAYINQLTARVKLLEERLAAQEERVVAKDYFKKIMSKVMNNFSGKSNSESSMPNIKRQSVRSHTANHFTQTDKGTTTDDEVPNEGYAWKWGEEVLKPGIDLKNRIVTLLTEIISKLSVTQHPTTKPYQKCDSEAIRNVVKQLQTRVYKMDQMELSASPRSYRKKTSFAEPITAGPCRKDRGDSVEKQKNRKDVDVSYVNPKLSLWRTDSTSGSGREEFLKIVSKAKPTQKEVLWKNIWNQAKANGQTKEDKITIKIPNKDQKLFATELKIGEVEEILKGGPRSS